MSADQHSNLPILSPPGSGRTSPAPRSARNAIENSLYKKDKTFRRYAASVERALALWDSAQQEWADYISFLGRLLKVLQSHPPEISTIPHSDAVALRLAQCLNPALPSGVHQKALEVYGYIFSTIGRDVLARDLHLHLPGLAPVLSFASLSVRPMFLSVLENYILKLDGDAIQPALKAIILSLLPGLEDDTSEDFEHMLSALDKLHEVTTSSLQEPAAKQTEGSSSHFWQCFFLATITNESRRQGALAFLARRLPKFGASSCHMLATDVPLAVEGLSFAAQSALSPEPGLLVRCFESGLTDSHLLIQRGFLDLLVSHLPLDSSVLQERISKGDLERLISAAASVVSRRDMSLNRRLWAWFVGPETNAIENTDNIASSTSDKYSSAVDPSTHHAAYFSKYGLKALANSVLKMIRCVSMTPAERARPFRICLSLMDRWEVGGLIVPDVFLPAMQNIHSYSETASREDLAEVMRSASAFFDGVDSGLIWGKLIHLFISSLQGNVTSSDEALQQIKLAKFILARFNLKEEDMLLHHMPLMAVSALVCLNESSEKPQQSFIESDIVNSAFEVIDMLVQLIPARALIGENATGDVLDKTIELSRASILQQIRTFYEESQGSLDMADPPFRPMQLGQLALREAFLMFSASIGSSRPILPLEMTSKTLASLITKNRQLKALEKFDPIDVIRRALFHSPNTETPLSFPHLSAMAAVLIALQPSPLAGSYIPSNQLTELVHLFVDRFWGFLSPVKPKYHVESARCMLHLHAIAPDERIVEAVLSAIIVRQPSQNMARLDPVGCGRNFATFWAHIVYELGLQSERRVSTIRRSNNEVPSSTLLPKEFHAILTRPLLILLDTLHEEESDMSAFMYSWLQDLPSLNRVFEILVCCLRSLSCLGTVSSLLNENVLSKPPARLPKDDTRECLYYLKHIRNILKKPSHLTWATISESLVSWDIGSSTQITLQVWLIRICSSTLQLYSGEEEASVKPHIRELHRTSVSIISQIYQSPFAYPIRELGLELPLMERLKTASPSLQSLLLVAGLSALKLRLTRPSPEINLPDSKIPSLHTHISRPSLSVNRDSEEHESTVISAPPQLIECLKYGFSSPNSRMLLDDWVHFLIEVLPMFADTIFQNLLPLVECLCKQINITFNHLNSIFTESNTKYPSSSESALISLINGLEQILAKAHQRLTDQETKALVTKSPEQPQGFFSNVVSGVFSTEANQTRIPTANSRLTVLLCFQDTVRICFSIWSWGGYGHVQGQQDPTSAASFAFSSLRVRNRARRILEHLFAAEALECLETLIVLWANAAPGDGSCAAITGLLNVLNGSRPKYTVPAIFNALYSRTDPSALDVSRISSLTSDLSDVDLVTFLVEYTRSLEDDAMDEIWQDCTVFLRDVLANPLPHRQILPSLLEFTTVIGGKIDNTTFGEQRKTRRDLADIFARILTAIFTTKSIGYLQDLNQIDATENAANTNSDHARKRATNIVSILNIIIPGLPVTLAENDRVAKIASDVCTSIISPTFRTKAFPENVSRDMLNLVQELIRIAPTSKALKKEIHDAFNDPKFFLTSFDLLKDAWLPILAQWIQSDRERLLELLTRLATPTTAGIMFGVGSASARQEADRKTQLTLRRIALLILANPQDFFTANITQISEKIVELLTTTPGSSPSSAIRAEVIVLLRSVIIKTSPMHLASLWPVINGELTSALSSLLPTAVNRDHYNNAGIMQICRLLDELVVLEPDDFQLIEWLFISDTIDAVYKPSNPPLLISLTDEINEVLSLASPARALAPHSGDSAGTKEVKMLLLDQQLKACEKEEGVEVLSMTRSELINKIVRPFLGSLAMHAYESRYRGGVPDWQGVWNSVVKDAAS